MAARWRELRCWLRTWPGFPPHCSLSPLRIWQTARKLSGGAAQFSFLPPARLPRCRGARDTCRRHINMMVAHQPSHSKTSNLVTNCCPWRLTSVTCESAVTKKQNVEPREDRIDHLPPDVSIPFLADWCWSPVHRKLSPACPAPGAMSHNHP